MRGGGVAILGVLVVLGCGSERSIVRKNSDDGGEGGGAGGPGRGGAHAGGESGRSGSAAGASGNGGATGGASDGGEGGNQAGAGGESSGAGGEGAMSGGGGEAPVVFGGLTVDTLARDQNFDLFETPGHHVWLEISEEQVQKMNQRGGGWFPGGADDIYQPGPSGSYADHFVVWEKESDTVADYGKLEVRLVGESTFRELSKTTIPNFRVDADEFQQGMRVGTFEHFRFNNGQIGTIFREWVVHHVYRELGYPALRSNYAFVGNTVWGEGVWVPMVLMEVYKGRFCNDNQELLGGDCVNMWEFPGDVSEPVGENDVCQLSECDNQRLNDLSDALRTAPQGEGFKEAMASFIDWPLYHQFQCLSWMLHTSDDPVHAGNNNVIVERPDGKLVWLPYSVDISTGADWSGDVPLYGSTTLPTRCQEDPSCWSDTIDACAALIEKFETLDPAKIVDDVRSTLDELGMLRPGDLARAADLKQWFVDRRAELADELEYYRTPPGPDGCPEELVLCPDYTCRTSEECDATCGDGYRYCEAWRNCYDPMYETCPDCQEPTPFYCRYSASCLESEDQCAAMCPPEAPYCPPAQDCNAYCWMEEPGGRPID